MFKIYFISLALFLSANLFGQTPALIPLPTAISVKQGRPFLVSRNTTLQFDETLAPLKELLLSNPFFKNRAATGNHPANRIEATIAKMPAEAYQLSVDENRMQLRGGSPRAIISGIYTVIQLLALDKNSAGIAPLEIADQPEYAYRGLHLDVSRHFLTVDYIKKFIDVMAFYKFNQLHWHLTDGPGWRLEIDKYPLLTQKAAWRNYASWQDWWNRGRQYVDEEDPNAYGGYYTKKEAREIVEYALARGISVIPEIEMPGHSEEVLAVYPELSCTGRPYTSSELCLGNPATYTFAKDVLSEVLEIFPSRYIHIGGDEAELKHWQNCPKCQGFMRAHGIKTESELQGYFMTEISRFLLSKGRTPIVWDEIGGSELPREVIIMNWRDRAFSKKAMAAGHRVISTPAEFLYLDQYQNNPFAEPTAMGGLLPLKKVYHFNPREDGDNAQTLLMGIQANLWTEHIPNPQQLEYMAFPRALAVAENAWSKPAQKNYEDFQKRLQEHYRIFNKMNVNYYRPSYHVEVEQKYDADRQSFFLKLDTEQPDVQIRYTTDGTPPSQNAPLYSETLQIKPPAVLLAALFRNGSRIGPVREVDIRQHKAIGKKVLYNTPWEGYPALGDRTLTNGNCGGKTYGDGEWQAFGRSGLDVVLDMESEQYTEIQLRLLHLPATGIYLPGEIRIYMSDDGKSFSQVSSVAVTNDPLVTKQTATTLTFNTAAPSRRFLRVVATNPKGGYIFTDEIVVN